MPHLLVSRTARPARTLLAALMAAAILTGVAEAQTLAGVADAPIIDGGQAAVPPPARPHRPRRPMIPTELQPVSRPTIDLSIGTGQLLQLGRPAAAVLVANPDIADVQTPSPNRVFIFGKASGTTTVYALDGNDGVILQQDIRIRQNTDEISQALKGRFPQYSLTLEPAPGSLVVSGQVDNAKDATDIIKTLEQFLGEKDKAINHLTITEATQVNLRVRVVEIDRTLTQQLGFNLQADILPGAFNFQVLTGRDFINDAGQFLFSPTGADSLGAGFANRRSNFSSFMDALDQEGLVSTLAEPNLTAVSGQTASFLVGGEFPVPISNGTGNNTTITIEFKPFGIALDFTPTVLSRDRISLRLRPEVSALSSTNSVTIDGLTIPGLQVRRMETTVELGSGQSFAVGGLLQSDVRDQVSKFPGLAELPILGQLFTSTNFQNNETELMVLVTPYVVRPTTPQALRSPMDALRPASDVEYVIQRRTGLAPGEQPSVPRLHGPAGFIY